MKLHLFLLACLLIYAASTSAQSQDTISAINNRLFELSFGQKILFISDSKVTEIRQDEAIVVPTSSVLLFAQFRPDKKLRIPVFFNLPIESKEFLVDGEIISERASPSLGTGLEYGLFEIPISNVAKLEFEVGYIYSVLFDENRKMRSSQLLLSRIRLQKGENLIMFLGGSYSLDVDSYGILFGTGTAF
ncbi:MAG: hypothetical protein AAGI23_01705 [Bacteroidota bacterium]